VPFKDYAESLTKLYEYIMQSYKNFRKTEACLKGKKAIFKIDNHIYSPLKKYTIKKLIEQKLQSKIPQTSLQRKIIFDFV
jgi:hypothetical protein